MIVIDTVISHFLKGTLMITTKKHNARRVSVWLLIFSLLMLTASAALPVHATPMMDGVGEATRDAAHGVGEAAKDVTNGVGNAVKDVTNGAGNAVRDVTDGATNGESGTVSDNDGVIGNEANEAADATTDTQSRVGQIALIVVIVAVVIAAIIIVLLIPKKRKD